MGYLCSTSCRIDVSTITVLRFINEIKRFGYLLLRIPILQHVLPLLPLITGRIFSFPPFPLEETTPSNPPTGGFHRFRSFFGKREEGEGPNWRVQVELRGSTMPRTFLRFFGGRFTRPVMHFSTGEKAERRTERERRKEKNEGRERGKKKRAKNRRILCSQPDLPPLPPSLFLFRRDEEATTSDRPAIVRIYGISKLPRQYTSYPSSFFPVSFFFFSLLLLFLFFFSFFLSPPPRLFPYAPLFVRALSRVFDYVNLVLRGRRVQPRSCIPRNDDSRGQKHPPKRF